MYDAINEVFLEFALTCKYLMKRGWDFVEINYGERRLDIGSYLKLKRGDEEVEVGSPDDMEVLLRKDIEEEERKHWENK